MAARKQHGGATIIVAGDVSIDWLAWPQPALDDEPGGISNWRQREGTRMVARRGGALLLVDLLRAATTAPVIGPHVDRIHIKSPDEHLHSLVDLAQQVGSNPVRFRVSRLRGFSGPDDDRPMQPQLEDPTAVSRAEVLVLDDSGNGFRHSTEAWQQLLAAARPRWLIVKMAPPLAAGPMWDLVRHGPLNDHGEHDPERLVVVVNAEDLRREHVRLSRRLSWDSTAEDFVRELASNGRLATLVTCANLIVRFDCDGTIHHRGRSAEPPVLWFDANHAEGEFLGSLSGPMMGMTAAFTAGLVAALSGDASAHHAIPGSAIPAAMNAARHLARTGFVADTRGAPDYPRDFSSAGSVNSDFVSRTIRSQAIADGARWAILPDTLGDSTVLARRVVLDGAKKALRHVPVASFGKLRTADRREIEGYRAIGNLLAEYLARPRTRPLSIGVFGPPGAGKSFGVGEVARDTASHAGGRKLEELTFNLSQFTSPTDLTSAFHLVRDKVLEGVVPLVFFDEFDSEHEAPLGWLRHFLAPMQDGKFREAGHLHPLGAAIFVFAGGTRPTFDAFAAPMRLPPDHTERLAFARAKGPDFVSRLRGHIDILGPDQHREEDRTYPLRRGFLLRSLLERDAPQLVGGGRARIDDGVLHALLTVPSYRHGVRSMEALLAMSALSGRTAFERAALPPPEQLGAHVDAEAFMARVSGEALPAKPREALGRRLHDAYRRKRLAIADTDQERAELAKDASMRDWDQLSPELRESNLLQADEIPRKLRLIDCFMSPPIEGRDAVERLKEEDVARLGPVEHDRFNAERLRRQWRLGERKVEQRRSPFLVPWNDLSAKWQSLDLHAVDVITEVLREEGWFVYRVE